MHALAREHSVDPHRLWVVVQGPSAIPSQRILLLKVLKELRFIESIESIQSFQKRFLLRGRELQVLHTLTQDDKVLSTPRIVGETDLLLELGASPKRHSLLVVCGQEVTQRRPPHIH